MSLREELKEALGETFDQLDVDAVIGVFKRNGWQAPARWSVRYVETGSLYSVYDANGDSVFSHTEEKVCQQVCDLLNEVAPRKD